MIKLCRLIFAAFYFFKTSLIIIQFVLDWQSILKIGVKFGLSITYLWWIWIALAIKKLDRATACVLFSETVANPSPHRVLRIIWVASWWKTHKPSHKWCNGMGHLHPKSKLLHTWCYGVFVSYVKNIILT